MPDISSGVIAGAGVATVTAASLIPGVNLEAVTAAFAGALFFMVFSKDLSWVAKAGYFVFSWIAGYFLSAEMVARGWTETAAIPAMFGGIFAVVVCISLMEWIQEGKTPGWIVTIADFVVRGRRDG
jgi:hypothetical protein|tara:strand:+ start:26 stop:403 length:378 start_codon:yes stop_codon:yes gene_type:complete